MRTKHGSRWENHRHPLVNSSEKTMAGAVKLICGTFGGQCYQVTVSDREYGQYMDRSPNPPKPEVNKETE